MDTIKKMNRRHFLRGAALAGAATALPSIIPSSALGRDGAVAPSNRVVMGAIGVGSQGGGNLNGFLGKAGVQVVAVCDVDQRNRDGAKRRVDEKNKNQDCAAYNDYRELVARKDIDAVSIALPDHWHGLIYVAALQAGFDVYGEKPLARSIREGRAIVDAVERYGRVWQTGSWQRSGSDFRHACELVRNGRIGKIEKVEVGLPTGSSGSFLGKPIPVPEGLDWKMWLGPAPERPYCSFGGDENGRCHWNWRWIMDYSGGQLTDWAGHHIDIAHWGMGYDSTGPVTIEGKGEYPEKGLYDAPWKYKFTCTYESGVPIIVGDNGSMGMGGTKWYGEKGWVHVDRGMLDASDKSLIRQDTIGAGDIRLYESRDHMQNFLDCVQSRRVTVTPVETAHRSISVGLLGEIAMLTGRKIHWDPKREEILNDPGAAALLRRPYRNGWVL